MLNLSVIKNPVVRYECTFLGLLCLIALVVGLTVGYVWPSLTIALLGYVVITLLRLCVFWQWMADPDEKSIPSGLGLWQQLYKRFYKQYRLRLRHQLRFNKYLKQYRRSMAALPDAVIFIDQEDRIQWMNEAAENMLGFEHLRDRGQRVDNLLRAPGLTEFLARADASQSLDIDSPDDSGQVVSLKAIRYGKKSRFLLVRNISEQKRTEQIRRDFVANASHELRTPLTVIRGYSEELLFDYEADSIEYEALGAITAQSQRMQLILDDLLVLARLESPDESVRADKINVGDIIQKAAAEAESFILERDQTISLCANSQWGLLAQANDMYSVIQNLLMNAIRYSGEGSTIELSWKIQNNIGVLAVSDNGIGIASSHLDRLTERFYRVDASREANSGGTGLGLSIVKHILENHHATLNISSEIGLGSVFRCEFPLKRLVKLSQ